MAMNGYYQFLLLMWQTITTFAQVQASAIQMNTTHLFASELQTTGLCYTAKCFLYIFSILYIPNFLN